jgi:hypothetical protein
MLDTVSGRCATLDDDFSSRIAEVYDDMCRQVRDARAAVADNAGSLRAHEEAISLRATDAACRQKAEQTDHLALEDAVREGLRRRAAVRTVRVVQGDVAALQAKCEYLDQVAGISRRFIEWFHNRGSAFEQNCVTIERQLNSLVVGSDPRSREAFSGKVRLSRKAASGAGEGEPSAAAGAAGRRLAGGGGDGGGADWVEEEDATAAAALNA